MAEPRPYPKKAARGFGPIHERMKGPTLPKGVRGQPQADNLPDGFRDGRPKRATRTQDAMAPKLPKRT